MSIKNFSKIRSSERTKIVSANKRINLHISKGDSVVLISGNDKGKEGVISFVDKKAHRVVVSGVSIYKKSVKKNENNPDKNFVFIERSVHVSKVKKIVAKN